MDNGFVDALLRSDKAGAEKALSVLAQGNIVTIESIIVSALDKIGSDWEDGKVSLAQIYLSGRICEDIVSQQYERNGSQVRYKEKCAIAILNDYHVLGKRIVLSALKSAGFNIADWGRMTKDELIRKVDDSEVDVLLLSTLMLSSAMAVEEVKKELDNGGYKGLLMVGGAPFRLDKKLWREVGADATANNAMASITMLSSLLGYDR